MAVKAGTDVRSYMVNWIRENYSEMLGDDVKYLDRPGGLEHIQSKYCSQFMGSQQLRKVA